MFFALVPPQARTQKLVSALRDPPGAEGSLSDPQNPPRGEWSDMATIASIGVLKAHSRVPRQTRQRPLSPKLESGVWHLGPKSAANRGPVPARGYVLPRRCFARCGAFTAAPRCHSPARRGPLPLGKHNEAAGVHHASRRHGGGVAGLPAPYFHMDPEAAVRPPIETASYQCPV